MTKLRLPQISGTDKEQLSQIKSYLYQFVGQLQFALNSIETEVSASSSPSTHNTQKKDPASNFNELKGLIIKSADIVNAYYEKIDALLKLSGEYTATSDFGTCAEKTNNQLSATNDKIQQTISDLQAIYDENGNIKAELLVNGHVYSGIIEYAMDGEAIIGIEIGQTTKNGDEEIFTRFARFTADRLAFYDASFQEEPVAYISNYMLVITNAWVKGNLEIGTGNHFLFDTSNGIALRPVQGV